MMMDIFWHNYKPPWSPVKVEINMYQIFSKNNIWHSAFYFHTQGDGIKRENPAMQTSQHYGAFKRLKILSIGPCSKSFTRIHKHLNRKITLLTAIAMKISFGQLGCLKA